MDLVSEFVDCEQLQLIHGWLMTMAVRPSIQLLSENKANGKIGVFTITNSSLYGYQRDP